MLRDVPRDTPGLKPHKTPPKSELVEGPEPRARKSASTYWQEWQRAGYVPGPFRRPKAEPSKSDQQ
jgi:hypothetical protein